MWRKKLDKQSQMRERWLNQQASKLSVWHSFWWCERWRRHCLVCWYFNGDFFAIIPMLYAFTRSSFTFATSKCSRSDLNLFISADRCVFHSLHTFAHISTQYSDKIFAYWIKFMPVHQWPLPKCSVYVRCVIYWIHEHWTTVTIAILHFVYRIGSWCMLLDPRMR